ncbi:MAG: SCO family protein [Planctomycetota bacterium]
MAVWSVAASAAWGQSRVGPSPLGNAAAPLPEEVDEAKVTQRLGSALPLDTVFVDEDGRPVKLADYFGNDKPVVLEFAYFECPLLCPMMMQGLVDATRGVAAAGNSDTWRPGEAFDIVTISINPDDSPVTAKEKQDEVVQKLGGDGSTLGAATREGWHFLTGRELDIKRVAAAAGFGYSAVPRTSDYAHPAVIIFASPEGIVTRYLPSHRYPTRDFRMALTEASEGRQGSLFDMILQLCYHYDDSLGTYTADALALMKLGGAVTVLTLATLIGTLLYFEKRGRRRHRDGDSGESGGRPGSDTGGGAGLPNPA